MALSHTTRDSPHQYISMRLRLLNRGQQRKAESRTLSHAPSARAVIVSASLHHRPIAGVGAADDPAWPRRPLHSCAGCSR